MVGSSKILTVSYGTFSCTLEGFDDSFSTMKAIAEYFRDLASDDRYFGAEPPTPDAEMLAKIAEREVSRRVEAKMDDGSIVLKTGAALTAVGAAAATTAANDASAVTPPETQAPSGAPETIQNFLAGTSNGERNSIAQKPVIETYAPVMPPVAEAPVQPAPQPFEPATLTPTDAYEEDDAPEEMAAPLAATPVADPDAPHLDADSVAAKLQRIRAVVGRDGEPEQTEDDAATPTSIFAEDDGETDAQEITASDDIAESFADITTDGSIEDSASIADDEIVGDASLDILNDAIAGDAEASDDDDADSADFAAEALAQDIDLGETADEVPAPVRARVIRMRRNQVDAAGALIGSATGSSETEGEAEDLGDTTLEDLQDSLSEETDLELSDISDQLQEDAADESSALLDDLGASAEAETEVEDLVDLGRLDGSAEDLDLSALEMDADVEEIDPSSLSADAEAELQAELASLVEDDVDGDADASPETLTLTSEDEIVDDMAAMVEDDLQANLENDGVEPAMEDLQEEAAAAADFEAELEEDAAAEDGPDDSAAGPLRPRRVRMPGTIDENDGSMDRIMSATEEQMSAPDSSRRRDAIDQLKAAVAATEADRELGDGGDANEGAEETFRDDLRQAVRPTRPIRPQRPTARSERSERPAPAPLKLVAAQRVDMPEVDAADAVAAAATAAAITPVRPRRVMKTDEPEVTADASGDVDAGGFAAFAQEMGATDLSDLLEAAAAYTSFVEGSEDFSRPQLMNKIKETSDQEYSREEGLRSFGTLLRQGRIMKVRNGRFQVSGETRFNPERRAG